jgi:hypothetical protein
MKYWPDFLVMDDIAILGIVIVYLFLYFSTKQKIFVILAVMLSLFTSAINIVATQGYNTYFILLSPFAFGLVSSLLMRPFVKRPLPFSLGIKSAPVIVSLILSIVMLLSSIALFVFIFILR